MSRMVDARLSLYLYDELNSGVDPSYRGAVAENFVLNEIMSAFGREPFYWKKGKYEVDFLIPSEGGVIPIEVKSGSRVRAVSLKNYIDECAPKKAIVLSKNLPKGGDVITLPLCIAWKIRSIVDGLKCGETKNDGVV